MRTPLLTCTLMLMGMLLAGCGTESGPTSENAPRLIANATSHNTADHFSFTEPVEETVINPCNGEMVQLAGTAVVQMNFVAPREALDIDLNLHREIHARVSETGIGLTTGASYGLRATFHEVFDSPTGPAVNFTFGFRNAARVTSATPGLSFQVGNTFHMVQLPSGEFKVTKDIETTKCLG